MPKPSTHEEYLASLIPPSAAAGVDRRVFMKGALGSAAALSLPALLAACGGSDGPVPAAGGDQEGNRNGDVRVQPVRRRPEEGDR